MPLATLPSKQGLKLCHLRGGGTMKKSPLATLPSKQGLKRSAKRRRKMMDEPLATLPSKQGLKPRALEKKYLTSSKTSCYTSIKTRIETPATSSDS